MAKHKEECLGCKFCLTDGKAVTVDAVDSQNTKESSTPTGVESGKKDLRGRQRNDNRRHEGATVSRTKSI